MKENRGLLTLICAWLLGFFMFGQIFVVSPMLGFLKNDLHVSYASLALLFSIPLVMLIIFAIPGGYIADRIGVRKAAGIAAVLIGAGAFLRGISLNFEALLLSTCIYGVGIGLAMPNLPKLVGGWFPDRIGTATGFYSTSLPSGVTATLAITLPLIYPIAGSWNSVFYIWGIMALIVAGVWWLIVKDPPYKAKSPSLQLPSFVWRDKDIWTVAIMLLVDNWVFYVVMGWLPTFFIMRRVNEIAAGLMTSTVTLVELIFIFVIPIVSDRVKLRKPFYWAAAIFSAIAFFGLLYTPLIYAWIWLFIIGVTIASMFSTCLILPVHLALLKFKNPGLIGISSGIVLSIGYIGGVIGPAVSGYLFDLYGTLESSLLVLVVISFIGLVSSLRIPETGKKPRNE